MCNKYGLSSTSKVFYKNTRQDKTRQDKTTKTIVAMTMTTPTHVVERLGLEDVAKAARTLLAAFDNDDVARYVSRHLEHDAEKREYVDILMYEAYVRSHVLRGDVLAIKGENHADCDTFESVALWVRPDSGTLDDWYTLWASGYARLAWHTGSEGRKRVFGTLMGVLHDEWAKILSIDPTGVSSDHCWTLVYLGTAPHARGRGNVRALMEYQFAQIDKDPLAITYLESSSVDNFPVYEKFGFRAVKDIWLGDSDSGDGDCARMDVMVRGPGGGEWEHLAAARAAGNYRQHAKSRG